MHPVFVSVKLASNFTAAVLFIFKVCVQPETNKLEKLNNISVSVEEIPTISH